MCSSVLSVSDFPPLSTGPPPGGAPAGPAFVERLSDDGSNDGNADDENADDLSSPLGPSPMEDGVVPNAVVNSAAGGPGGTNGPLVVSVKDRSEKGDVVNDIESTLIKESKVNASTVVESELSDLQSNVTENEKVNVVGNIVSNSLQNGVFENERIPADDNDSVLDNDFDVSYDAKGITNRKRKLSTDSEDNVNEGSAKVGNISLES